MTTEADIAEAIRLARRLAGMTQEEAARELGVAIRTYARWETGESKGFMEHLDEIAEALGTTTAQLVGAERDTTSERMEALEAELRELKLLLLDPKRLRAAADALAEEEGV